MSNALLHLKNPSIASLLATVLLFLLPACTDPDKKIEEKFSEASAHLDEGRHEEAIPLLQELNEERPERADFAERLAFAYASAGRHSEAARTFTRAAELAEGRDDLLLFAARSYEEAGELEDASRHYRLFLVANQDNFTGWQALAGVEEKRGRHRDAADAYLNAHRLRANPETAAKLGDLFLRLQNVPQAARWYNRSLEQGDEAAAPAKAGLLQIHLEEENWTEAIELVEDLDENHPGYIDETGLAEVREELREWRAAQEEFERLRQEREAEDRERQQAREQEAQRQRELERIAREEEERREQEAAEALEREQERLAREAEELAREEAEAEARRADPDPRRDEADRLAAEARVARSERRLDSAISLYWQALAHDDSAGRTWYELSRALFARERFPEAESTVLEALRRSPEREDYYVHYLDVISETQSMRAYLRELEQVRERFPRNANLTYRLAEAYAQGDWSHEEAARYYRRFLQLSSADDPRREEAQAFIREHAGR